MSRPVRCGARPITMGTTPDHTVPVIPNAIPVRCGRFLSGQLTFGPVWSDLAGLGWVKAGSASVRWGRTEVGG
eukprot:gene15951-biopygen12769